MSSYTNCCATDYSRNSTNIRYYLYWYTPDDGATYPYRSCATALAGNAVPLPRTDTFANCYPDPFHVPACGTNGMGKGAWPWPYPTQTFEKLSVLKNVSFTYFGTEITAFYLGHGLKVGSETFTISNQTGTNAVLNGSWVVSSIYDNNTFKFNISVAPTTTLSNADLDFRKQLDFCTRKGFKVVHAKRSWNGRYGFTDDYVASPKSASTKFQSANYAALFSENYSGFVSLYDTSGNFIGTNSGQGQHSCSTSSFNSLSAGGVASCLPKMNYNDGAANWFTSTDSPPSNYNYFQPCSPISCQGDVQIPITMPTTGYQALINAGLNESTINQNKQLLKDITFIDADRSIVTFKIPWLKTIDGYNVYQGSIDGIGAWLAGFNINDESTFCGGGEVNQFKNLRNFTIINQELTNNKFTITIKCSSTYSYHLNYDDGECNAAFCKYYSDWQYEGTYTATVNLGAENTAGAIEADALSLLNQWDMTNDSIYPWRTDDNCGVAPMVIRKELNGTAPAVGYCESTADLNLYIQYDGSIYGAPLPVGYYNKGWFDFYEKEYHYTDDGMGAGTQQLCYTYGNYAPDYLPSTVTHWTDGALDTNDRGGYWQPFSRYKSDYNYALPPFVNHGCAFAANNQEAYWVSKWAELKEPLPSQNYWGACGVQPNQCAKDSHGGAFATCEPMRDLHVLEAGTCEITADLRYPNAFAICGKSIITNISVNMFGYTHIIHSSAPYLRVGDKIDLLDATGNRPYFNITVTDVVSDTEFYCGTGGVLPTGVVAVASWGSPDPNWYDLSPKGYFVKTNDKDGVITSQEGNVKSTGATRGIIAIVPSGSPELSNPKWPAWSTVFYSDYPYIQPTSHWYSAINQAMSDRFWITSQDAQVSDGDETDPHCAIKQKNGMPCIIAPCDPILTPLVEARLYAPTGAPLQFATNSANQWIKMTPGDQWGTTCSNVWNYGESATAFTKQYGVANNYGDSLNTSGISTDTDIGWGTADGYFIP